MKERTALMKGEEVPGFIHDMTEPLRDYYLAKLPEMKKSIALFYRQPAEKWMDILGLGAEAGRDGRAFSAVVMKPFESYLGRGGKCLRSLLTCAVLEAYGRRVSDFLPLVGMMEVLESSTILIDDFIDNSPYRRGGPSAHLAYGLESAAVSALGIYYGSWNLFSPRFLPVTRRAETQALSWFARGHLRTCLGQMEELVFMGRGRPLSLAEYANSVRNHISTLSFAGPLYLPALACGAPGKELELLEELGEMMGLAYHLHGDELNIFPPDGGIGKLKGDDIVGGIMTYLISSAVRLSRPREKKELLAILGDERVGEKEINRAVRLIDGSGARALNRGAIDRFSGRASAIVARLPFEAAHKGRLRDLLTFMGSGRKK